MKFVILGSPKNFLVFSSGHVTTGPLPWASAAREYCLQKSTFDVCPSGKSEEDPGVCGWRQQGVLGCLWGTLRDPVGSLWCLDGVSEGLAPGFYRWGVISKDSLKCNFCPVGDTAPRPQGHTSESQKVRVTLVSSQMAGAKGALQSGWL